MQQADSTDTGSRHGAGEQLTVERGHPMLLPRRRVVTKRIGANQIEDLDASTRQVAIPHAGTASRHDDEALPLDVRALDEPVHERNPVQQLETDFAAPRPDHNRTIRTPEQRRPACRAAMMPRVIAQLRRSVGRQREQPILLLGAPEQIAHALSKRAQGLRLLAQPTVLAAQRRDQRGQSASR